jgi:hypothetical protein
MESQAKRIYRSRRLACALALGVVGGLAAAGCEGGGVSGPQPTSTASMALEGGAECSAVALGDDQTCRDDLTWRAVAEATCAQDGLELAALGFAHACGPDRFQAVEFSCCPAAEPTERSEPERREGREFAPAHRPERSRRVPVQAAVATCESQLLGSDSDCRYPEEWEDLADAFCRSSSTLMGASESLQACGDGRDRFLEFSCCPAAQPDPDPAPQCFAGELGGETLCKDAATWLASAEVACDKWGAAVDWSELGASCGEGLFSGVNFSCCENRDLEPGQCIEDRVGSPEACESASAWQNYAETVCGDRGAEVMAMNTQEHCGSDGWRFVSFSCCAEAHGK